MRLSASIKPISYLKANAAQLIPLTLRSLLRSLPFQVTKCSKRQWIDEIIAHVYIKNVLMANSAKVRGQK